MSISEYTINIRTPTAERPQETTQNAQRELFRAFMEKYIMGIVVTFTMLITFIFSVYAATRTEYLPSAIILMVTLEVIARLLERSKDNG